MEKNLPIAHTAWKPRKPALANGQEYRIGLVDAHEVVAISEKDTWAGPVGNFLAQFVPVNPEEAFA